MQNFFEAVSSRLFNLLQKICLNVSGGRENTSSKVFVQRVCARTISQPSRGCAQTCCNPKKTLLCGAGVNISDSRKKLTLVCKRVITLRSSNTASSSRQYQRSKQPHRCSMSKIIFPAWRRQLLLQQKLRINVTVINGFPAATRLFIRHLHPKHLLLKMPSRRAESNLR